MFGLQVLQEPVGPTGADPEGRSEGWGHIPGHSERRERSDGQSETEVTCWATSPRCPTSAALGDRQRLPLVEGRVRGPWHIGFGSSPHTVERQHSAANVRGSCGWGPQAGHTCFVVTGHWVPE